MDRYAAAWHIEWIKGTHTAKHLKSITGYIQTLRLWFEFKDANNEDYADLEKVRYNGYVYTNPDV
jgi:IS5 family transposase